MRASIKTVLNLSISKLPLIVLQEEFDSQLSVLEKFPTPFGCMLV